MDPQDKDDPVSPANPASRVLRWEEYGGTWRVVARGASGVTVELCSCTGGEVLERWTSDDPDLITLVDTPT
ncbi:hypothetical protein IDM40_07445 [Nocardiopsis sp. HNM0947]|uniref:Uncharacterized protein n=1 Tax=Nocardiopsis coralli TaxID=2772213 RepID=A0ABR9P481_9ACTN|nr:hypothetical protein [Nocardiopsis coralli]MBE2998535.1 hypothetical protein [Nocardiopsis coralli]